MSSGPETPSLCPLFFLWPTTPTGRRSFLSVRLLEVLMPKMWQPRPESRSDRRERLEALRDRLTQAVAEAGTRDLAPLARQLTLVLAELDGLNGPTEVTKVD